MTLTVIGPRWTRTSRVLWCLEELSREYEHQEHPPHSPPVKALNTLNQVPILKDGETVLTDSVAILHHLADRAGRLTYPAGSIERARMEARVNFVITELEVPLWMRNRHTYVLPEEMRRPDIFGALDVDFRLAEKKFDRLLGEAEFFGGEDFTIADIIATAVLGWGDGQLGLTREPVRAYLARMQARPAFAAAKA
ncbi:MAG: glutathione S-transferase family protein [Pseudomonadota bacterium]